MDERRNFDGGEINVTNNELDLMPNSNRGGIYGIAAAIADGQNIIFSGVNASIDASSVTVEDGFVFLDGELLKVDAGTVNDTEGRDLYVFEKTANITEPGFERNYRNGDTNNVASINRAVPSPVSVVEPGQLSVTGKTALTRLRELIRIQADFAETDSNEPDFIRNKPTIPTVPDNIPDVRNRGSIGAIDLGSIPSPIVRTGDATAATATQNSTTLIFTVTMANEMSNNGYFLRLSVRSNSGDLRVATDFTGPVYRNINTTQFQLAISERFAGGAQNIEIFFEAVDNPANEQN